MRVAIQSGSIGAIAATVMFLAGALAGCGKTLHVDLPQDFHGPVTLLCGSGSEATDVHVPSGGSASGVPCPRQETTLAVTRGGQRVSPESKPVWHFTGDGMPISIEFRIP